jgi:hypothetical protein
LLEVVTEDLFQLDEVAAVLLEPSSELLVQPGSDCLRKRVIRGVPDQNVTESKRIVACDLGRIRPDKVLPYERRQPCGQLPLVGGERVHRTPVEYAAFY